MNGLKIIALAAFGCGIPLITAQPAEAAPKACRTTDNLGSFWSGHEANGSWKFEFKRRGCSNVWDASWYNPSIALRGGMHKFNGVIRIYQNGKNITINRPSSGGVSCTYNGTLKRVFDEINTSVNGTYKCSNNYVGPWFSNVR